MSKRILPCIAVCFALACGQLYAQSNVIKNFEFSKDEKKILITGMTTSEKPIFDLYAQTDEGETVYLGGLEVFPVDNQYGFSLGLSNQGKWPKGTYQLAISDFYKPSDVTYSTIYKSVGDDEDEDELPNLSLMIFPFVNLDWLPTLDRPEIDEDWVKPCHSHIVCEIFSSPNPAPFTPPATHDGDDSQDP